MSAEENAYVEAIMFEHPEAFVWLGATDLMTENKWFWAHSDTPVSGFTFWNKGQPDNAASGENCMEFRVNKGFRHWNDDPCSSKKPFICQKPYDSVVIGK